MEQDAFAVLGKKDGLYPRGYPHILAELLPLHLWLQNSKDKVPDWYFKWTRKQSQLSKQQVSFLVSSRYPLGAARKNPQEEGCTQKLEAELYGAWCKYFCPYQESQSIGTLLKTQSLQSLHHHRASLHFIYALRLCFATDTDCASTTREKCPFFFVFC